MIQITLTPAQNSWLEVTWTDVVQAPDVVIPATPDELDDEGYLIAEGEPERTEPGAVTKTDLKHVSYHPTQLHLLQADAAAMGAPLDEYANMLNEWVADYVPPAPELTPVPQVLTMRQARLVLLSVDLLDDVEAAVAQADRATQIEWEFAQEINRTWPTLLTLAASLGLTDENLDGLFIQGAAL